MTRNFSPAQFAYIVAQAQRQSIYDAVNAAIPAPAEDASDDELDAWLDQQAAMEVELGLGAAEETLKIATDNLIDWIASIVKPQAEAKGGESLELANFLFGRATTHYNARCKVVDLAMRYAA